MISIRESVPHKHLRLATYDNKKWKLFNILIKRSITIVGGDMTTIVLFHFSRILFHESKNLRIKLLKQQHAFAINIKILEHVIM